MNLSPQEKHVGGMIAVAVLVLMVFEFALYSMPMTSPASTSLTTICGNFECLSNVKVSTTRITVTSPSFVTRDVSTTVTATVTTPSVSTSISLTTITSVSSVAAVTTTVTQTSTAISTLTTTQTSLSTVSASYPDKVQASGKITMGDFLFTPNQIEFDSQSSGNVVKATISNGVYSASLPNQDRYSVTVWYSITPVGAGSCTMGIPYSLYSYQTAQTLNVSC